MAKKNKNKSKEGADLVENIQEGIAHHEALVSTPASPSPETTLGLFSSKETFLACMTNIVPRLMDRPLQERDACLPIIAYTEGVSLGTTPFPPEPFTQEAFSEMLRPLLLAECLAMLPTNQNGTVQDTNQASTVQAKADITVPAKADATIPGMVNNVDDNGGASQTGTKLDWAKLFSVNRQFEKGLQLPDLRNSDLEVNMKAEYLSDVEDNWGYCLVGFFAGKSPGRHAIYEVKKAWPSCKFYLHASGWIIFRFETDEARQQVLSSSPHVAFGKQLMLKMMPIDFNFSFEEACIMPLWVTLTGVPMCCWNELGIAAIASKVGRPIATDVVTAKRERPGYVRVLVEADIAKELTKSIKVNMPSGSIKYVSVGYEHIPQVCTICKSFGHGNSSCQAISGHSVQQLTITGQKPFIVPPKKGSFVQPKKGHLFATQAVKATHGASTSSSKLKPQQANTSKNGANNRGEAKGQRSFANVVKEGTFVQRPGKATTIQPTVQKVAKNRVRDSQQKQNKGQPKKIIAAPSPTPSKFYKRRQTTPKASEKADTPVVPEPYDGRGDGSETDDEYIPGAAEDVQLGEEEPTTSEDEDDTDGEDS